MSNIQNLPVLKDESGTWIGGVITPYDLQCNNGISDVNKQIKGVYVTILATVITEVTSPLPTNAKFVTKVTNQCTSDVAYLDILPGLVNDLFTYSCPICNYQSDTGDNVVPIVKHYNMDNGIIGSTNLQHPDFADIPIDTLTGLRLVWVERDTKDQYENQTVNGWRFVAPDSIELSSPINDGEQIAIKFFKIV